MKEYEIYNNLKVPKGFKLILRLDGRNFHSLSKNLGFKKTIR
ncbi:tRNA(His) guanylyltransferase Thg1 family protein [Methanobrevibacter arboriphilus]|nr:tRNA(His) guanylyltransferase Thg1 family protein [Methanobrevibacter arboriphilus]